MKTYTPGIKKLINDFKQVFGPLKKFRTKRHVKTNSLYGQKLIGFIDISRREEGFVYAHIENTDGPIMLSVENHKVLKNAIDGQQVEFFLNEFGGAVDLKLINSQ